MTPRISKAELVRRLIREKPDISPAEAMKRCNCSSAVFYAQRAAVNGQGKLQLGEDYVDQLIRDVKIIREMGLERAKSIISLLEKPS